MVADRLPRRGANCGAADLTAHSGVDCADEAVCAPAREPVPKDYSNWQQHADTRLAERCRNDFDRYGICSVLFELTSYDKDFATGALDETAVAAYELTLDELQALAVDEGAVFMTLGQWAAAQRISDETAPTVTIAPRRPGRTVAPRHSWSTWPSPTTVPACSTRRSPSTARR